jgi:hypothetical protein
MESRYFGNLLYILDENRTPVEVDWETWGEWFAENFENRTVASDLVGAAKVSTVFLAINHGMLGPEPLVFETMVFGGPSQLSGWRRRYSTWETAEEGHREIVQMVREVVRGS